ncbi:MAG: LysE family translocator [Gammaproteobacteria bacterium]
MDAPLSALAFGLGLGASAGFAPGPLATLVIRETMRHGAAAGLCVALAPLVTDLPIIALALGVAGQADAVPHAAALVGLVGAAYLAWIARETWCAEPPTDDGPQTTAHPLRQGAVVNLLNPHPWLFWFTVGAPWLAGAAAAGLAGPVAFLLGFYVTLVGAKMLLALLTGRWRTQLLGRPYHVVMRALAVLLAFFALRLGADAGRVLLT